jgi:hypothetical protein
VLGVVAGTVVDAGGAGGCPAGSAGIGALEPGAPEAGPPDTGDGVSAVDGDDVRADGLCGDAPAATVLSATGGLRPAGATDAAGFGVALGSQGTSRAVGFVVPEGFKACMSTET